MIGKGEILVIDDFIDLEYQEKIKDNLMGDNSFPWYYIDDVTAALSVAKIKRSNRTHAHKTQAAIAMEQRAKVAKKTEAAGVYRKFIEEQKRKTKEKNK